MEYISQISIRLSLLTISFIILAQQLSENDLSFILEVISKGQLCHQESVEFNGDVETKYRNGSINDYQRSI